MNESKKRVLIVDNNEKVLFTLQRVLENSGFDTYATWSGCEALDLLKTQDFQVLVNDAYYNTKLL
jgi:CheY-like chemotaxis protein